MKPIDVKKQTPEITITPGRGSLNKAAVAFLTARDEKFFALRPIPNGFEVEPLELDKATVNVVSMPDNRFLSVCGLSTVCIGDEFTGAWDGVRGVLTFKRSGRINPLQPCANPECRRRARNGLCVACKTAAAAKQKTLVKR